MSTLVKIEVRDTEAQQPARHLEFARLPVRIGRNQLNDVHLDDPFASDWHGVLRMEARGLSYFDLGSLNGTMMAGQRLGRNVATPLANRAVLTIGRSELSIAIVERTGERQPVAPARFTTTLNWAADEVRSMMEKMRHDEAGGAGGASPARATGGVARTATPASPFPAAVPRPSGVAPAYARPTPLPARSPSSASLPPASGSAVGEVAAAAPELPDPGTPEGQLARMAGVLRAFADAFVGLRKGYQQFGSEVGIRTIHGNTPLHHARDGAQLVEYLLGDPTQTLQRMAELTAVFADFGIHHIAMMEAVTQGARSVVTWLDPKSRGLSGGLFGGRGKFRELEEDFTALLENDEEMHGRLFGAEFVRAYTSVVVGETNDEPEPR